MSVSRTFRPTEEPKLDRNQEILEISKLVFELTLVGASSNDLDQLLERLFGVLENLPSVQVTPKGLILLFNPRQHRIQVAQHGMAPLWDEGQEAALAALEALMTPSPADAAYIVVLPDGQRFFVLPLFNQQTPLGEALIGIAPEWNPEEVEILFMNDLARALSSLVIRCLINETLQVREIELEEARTDAIRRLGAASEYRDNETGLHLMRMTHIASAIGKVYGLPENQREILAITAPMHDVGKIGISDAILLKPGRLTDEEFDTMKHHTEIGERILKGEDELITAAREIAGAHHERWDGTGYPRGLKGWDIPVLARICAIADVFDALTSVRPYKEAWPVERAVEWIHSQSGHHFDPAVVEAFDIAMPEILRIRTLYRDDIIDPDQILSLPEQRPRLARFVEWDDELSVGISVIDEHHRYLFDLTNDLFDVVENKRGSREVTRVLKVLDQYARIHFDAEERMMAHYAFEGTDRQRHQHRDFEQKLRTFYEELHINPVTAQFDVLNFLRGWLVHHIRHEDARLRSLVRA